MIDASASPCIGICLLDPRSGYCRGCARTLGEIAEWASASPVRRREIVAGLPPRIKQLGDSYEGPL